MAIGLVGGRYELLDPIGIGGMGEVYRSRDRITGEIVALKRALQMPAATGSDRSPVTPLVPTRDAVPSEPSADDLTSDLTPVLEWSTISPHVQLALASEFRVLSSLRHPNIISVLDYGFEETGLPFFTMELLTDARPIVAASRETTRETKIDFLFQILHALSYLHRHGVLHRDLKSSNVLVGGSHVTVLDFGVSGLPETTLAGTFDFIAPEVMRGAKPSPSSDFYAVGAIAFEMFTGQAFSRSQKPAKKIDLTPLNDLGAIGALVRRLIADDPIIRGYREATTLLHDLAEAAGMEVPRETPAHRESYLKAAPLTGREEELHQLVDALEVASSGTGSVWLVGGESGVGKSRLLDELRARAQIQGFLALIGAAQEVGAPFSLFRDSVLRLALLVELSEQEATTLKAVFPSIDRVVDFPVPDSPSLDPQIFAGRLIDVIVGLFARYPHPLLFEIEDCHFIGESLPVLTRLIALAKTQKLMIVAAYRDDERPQLPNECPGMRLLKVARFGASEIERVAVSMLGRRLGINPAIVSFLERETEGNAFFLVEAARELAKQSGRLDEVSPEMLPDHVFSGGMKEYVRRRLERLPSWARRSIELAALLGREIDLDVLRAADGETDLDRLLVVSGDAAILEGYGYQWRFTHDKLREAVLRDMEPATKKQLSLDAASAIEKLHGESPRWIQTQAMLWKQAEVPVKAAHYLVTAAVQMLSAGVPERALSLAVEAARQLGVDIPENPAEQGAAIGAEMGAIGALLAGRSPRQLIDLPPLEDERTAGIIQVLQLIGPAAHISQKPELFALCVLKSFALTLRHGVGRHAPGAVAMYAAVARSMTGDSRLGYALSQLAIDLDHRQAGRVSSPVAFLHTWFVNHWIQPLHTNLDHAAHGAKVGFAENDLLYGSFNASAGVMYLGLSGAPLHKVLQEANAEISRIDGRVRIAAFHCLLERQFVLALMGRTHHRLSLSDDRYDEERDLGSILTTSNYNQWVYLYIAKMRLHYYYGEYKEALEYSEKALPLLAAFAGQVGEWDFAFYRALASLGRAAELDSRSRKPLVDSAAELLERFSQWATLCPPTFAHKRDLIEAELTRLRGEEDDVEIAYAAAVAAAEDSGFLHDAALANERAALYLAEAGLANAAQEHARNALAAYANWGALAKCIQLRERLHGVGLGAD
jgi:tetratricopeptide (TPR) repeat protein